MAESVALFDEPGFDATGFDTEVGEPPEPPVANTSAALIIFLRRRRR